MARRLKKGSFPRARAHSGPRSPPSWPVGARCPRARAARTRHSPAHHRARAEAADLAASPFDWGSAEPIEGDLFKWRATVVGPEGTPYEGGVFNVSITVPTEYPFRPPEVLFTTKIYHPNVKTDTGEICAEYALLFRVFLLQMLLTCARAACSRRHGSQRTPSRGCSRCSRR